MSSSVLEQIRSQHVDVEQLQRRVVQHLIQAAAASPGHQPSQAQAQSHSQYSYERLTHEHAAAALMSDWKGRMRRTLSLYTDDGALQQQQLADIQSDDPWASFYSTLSSLRLHSSSATASAAPPSASSAPPAASFLPSFTAEEAYGRHLDLSAFHLRYVNLAFHTRVDYLSYLSLFSSFASVSPQRKTKSHQAKEYRLYLSDLRDYLAAFHRRLRPLVRLERLHSLMQDEFESQWAAKRVPGWFEETKEEAADDAKDGGRSDADPLYCAACKRRFAKDTVYAAHLTGKKHQKAEQERAAAASSASASALSSAATALAHEMAGLEWAIHHFAALLTPTVQATITFTQHKQTLTPSELAQEIQASLPPSSSSISASGPGTSSSTSASSTGMEDDDDDSAPLYNPLHLPLGWDGKPIPFWLYKLNGLNQLFTCEICGGYTYAGPKVYREHFSQWRHAWGMRCLGIPNIRELWHVTGMEEVKALWDKIRAQETAAAWKEDEEEEMEDVNGNVFSKKQFLELQRQGLI